MLKILSIGNSFCQDAQRYLTRFAKAAGVDIMTRNLEIGGCSLEQHWNYFKNDEKNYTLEKDGVWAANEYTLTQGLMEDEWDIITIQQVSQNAGKPETFEPYLPNLLTAIRALCPNAKLYFQETWEYEIGSTHYAFPEYGCDPDVMFERVKKTCREKAKENDLLIIPSGEAIHAAKQLPEFDPAKGGQSLYRDGFHMHLVYGRYLLACVWFKTLLGRTPVGNNFMPDDTQEGEVVNTDLLVKLQKIGGAYYEA